MIPLPDPRFCNLHLAIARLFTASGLAEVFDEIVKDWEADKSSDGSSDRLDFQDEVWRRLAFTK